MSEPHEPAMWDDESAGAEEQVDEPAEPAEPAPDQTSGSEVADASVILLLQVREAHFSPWAPVPGEALSSRTGRLLLAVTGVFKGRVDQALNQPFEIEISQRGQGRITDYYGPWTHVAVRPAGVLLAFSKGPGTDARVLLGDQHCQVLLAATPELIADAREAAQLEARRPSPETVLGAANGEPERHGDLFARFVTSQAARAAVRSQPLFEAYLRLVENPRTTPPARDVYLTGIYEGLEDLAAPPRPQEILLAQCMFRLLILPAAAELKENIAGVLLPNLLRVETGKPKYKAAEILPSPQFDRAAIAAALNAAAGDEGGAKNLKSWLAK